MTAIVIILCVVSIFPWIIGGLIIGPMTGLKFNKVTDLIQIIF